MIRILVSGSIDLPDEPAVTFARYLGAEIIKQGHILLNGCLSDLDRIVAESAFQQAQNMGLEATDYVTSYILTGTKPSHNIGTILRSHLRSWELTDARLAAPEQISLADVVLLVGGAGGTWQAANWARFTGTPILPVTAFGGTAERVYAEVLRNFDEEYGNRIDRSHYERLNLFTTDYKKLATDVVSIAERMVSSKYVFVIMSFSGDPRLEDAYDSFQEVCEEFDYKCSKIDDSSAVDRILPEIFSHIAKSAFVIVDITEERANVYYELGYAQGLNKPTVVTAAAGTNLPFDVKDIPTIFWESQKQLKVRLRARIGEIAESHGR